MIGPMAQSGPPAIPPPSAAMQAEFQRAIDLANSGKHTDAELEFKQFELQHAGYAAPAIDLGLLTRQEGKLSDSEAALRHATELDGSSCVAWDELGITLRGEGKFAHAREAYQHAISANDSYAPAHRNMGVLLDLYLDDPAAAIPQFERYKSLTSEDKPVSTWIAELRARTGIKAPAAAPAPESPDNGAPSAPAAAPSSAAASNSGGPT
jgi:tetratricopeptide (TPR) repeat protein